MKRQKVVRILGVGFAFACVAKVGWAQTLTPIATQPATGQSPSVAAQAQEATNPFATSWLMQIQQNNNWVDMPSGHGSRVQSNLLFQPLMSLRLTENQALVIRPVVTLFNSVPHLDQNGQRERTTAFGDTVLAFAVPRPLLGGRLMLGAGPTFISQQRRGVSSAKTHGRSGRMWAPCCSSGAPSPTPSCSNGPRLQVTAGIPIR